MYVREEVEMFELLLRIPVVSLWVFQDCIVSEFLRECLDLRYPKIRSVLIQRVQVCCCKFFHLDDMKCCYGFSQVKSSQARGNFEKYLIS